MTFDAKVLTNELHRKIVAVLSHEDLKKVADFLVTVHDHGIAEGKMAPRKDPGPIVEVSCDGNGRAWIAS